MEYKVAELIRVSRDRSAIILKNDDSTYSRLSTTGDLDRADSSTMAELVSGQTWRRVTKSDNELYQSLVVVASGKVFTETTEAENKPRLYRVPPTVKRSISDALEAYSSLLSDKDREIATRLATRTQVDAEDVVWMHRFFENIEKAQSLHGGRRGRSWAQKVLTAEESTKENAVTAAADTSWTVFDFEADNPNVLFVAGSDDPYGDVFDTLYMIETDLEHEYPSPETVVYEWKSGEFVPTNYNGETLEREFIIELDSETAESFARLLDTPDRPEGFVGFSLVDIYPEERNLFQLASSELDYEQLDRFSAVLADATGYSAPERSQNAQRQPRAPGGQFGGGSPEPVGDELDAFAKAKIDELPLVDDFASLLSEYLESVSSDIEPTEDEDPVVAAGEMPTNIEPLYLAVVDDVDKTAVMDAVAIIPDENGEPTGWRRVDGEWQADADILADIQGDTPPPLVRLDDEELIKDVLAQIDEHDGQPTESEEEPTEEETMAASAWELAGPSADTREKLAKKGEAMPDGSFPIANESDLKKAIKAHGRAKDKAAAKRHIKKRARALNRYDLVPDEWKAASIFDDEHLTDVYGPYGEIIMSVTAAGVPGIADTPEDFRNVERLKKYWSTGAGAAKIRWGTPGDLTRCHRNVVKYLKNSGHAWGYCQNLHQRIFGVSNHERDN